MLAGELRPAAATFEAFHSLWRKFNALPERFDVDRGKLHDTLAYYPLRPELAESAYLLHRATNGRDPVWRAAGRRMVRRQQGQGAAQEHAAPPAAVRGMMMIGQRLFSGRVAVAQVAPRAHTRRTHACVDVLLHARTSMRAHLSWPWRRQCASLLPGDPLPVCRRR